MRYAILLGLLLLAGCAGRPAFLGTWVSGDYAVSFNADGTAVSGGPTWAKQGTWREAGDHVLEITAGGQTTRSRWTVSEDGKALTISLVGGTGALDETNVFTRK